MRANVFHHELVCGCGYNCPSSARNQQISLTRMATAKKVTATESTTPLRKVEPRFFTDCGRFQIVSTWSSGEGLARAICCHLLRRGLTCPEFSRGIRSASEARIGSSRPAPFEIRSIQALLPRLQTPANSLTTSPALSVSPASAR
jgi:hypothetical protein